MWRSQQRPLLVAASQMLDFVALVGSGLVFVLVMRRGLEGAFNALAMGGLVSGGVASVYIWLVMKGSLDTAVLRTGVKFSLPFMFQGIASWILNAGDRWFLKFAGHNADVGSLALAVQLTQPTTLPVAAIADSELPRIGEVLRADGLKRLEDEFRVTRRRHFYAALVPGVLLTMAIPLIKLVVPAVSGVAWAIPLLCIVGVVDAQFYPAQIVIYYVKRSRWIAASSWAATATTLGLMVVFVPQYGFYGALFARSAGSCVRTLVVTLGARSCLATLAAAHAVTA